MYANPIGNACKVSVHWHRWLILDVHRSSQIIPVRFTLKVGNVFDATLFYLKVAPLLKKQMADHRCS